MAGYGVKPCQISRQLRVSYTTTFGWVSTSYEILNCAEWYIYLFQISQTVAFVLMAVLSLLSCFYAYCLCSLQYSTYPCEGEIKYCTSESLSSLFMGSKMLLIVSFRQLVLQNGVSLKKYFTWHFIWDYDRPQTSKCFYSVSYWIVLQVSHGCVSKILQKYNMTGSITPGSSQPNTSRKDFQDKVVSLHMTW